MENVIHFVTSIVRGIERLLMLLFSHMAAFLLGVLFVFILLPVEPHDQPEVIPSAFTEVINDYVSNACDARQETLLDKVRNWRDDTVYESDRVKTFSADTVVTVEPGIWERTKDFFARQYNAVVDFFSDSQESVEEAIEEVKE